MRVQSRALRPRIKRWPLMRGQRMNGASASLLAAYAAAVSLSTPSLSKTPGEVHCYNGICHRVKAVEEMKVLVGTQTDALTSYYDIPERDRMNVGTITSSGEEFDAYSDHHAASSLYPDGTELLIWNPKNQKAAHIRVNDFGPFYMLRTIDVTRGVAEKLEFHTKGVAKLRVIVIWAPSQEEASFRRHRVYPEVEGYLGRIDADQLTALTYRLIATGPVRNGRSPQLASVNLRQSLSSLPAFASLEPANDRARRKALILNTPQSSLGLRIPVLAVATSQPQPVIKTAATLASLKAVAPVRALSISSSAQAIAAASQPPSAIVAARDHEVAMAVASLSQATSEAEAAARGDQVRARCVRAPADDRRRLGGPHPERRAARSSRRRSRTALSD